MPSSCCVGFCRALRRPVTQTEISEYAELVSKRLAVGAGFQDAMLAAYRMILTSPEFMLIEESVGSLNDHALATRLSYFLWSTLPDAELLQLADEGKLRQPDTLRQQLGKHQKNISCAACHAKMAPYGLVLVRLALETDSTRYA